MPERPASDDAAANHDVVNHDEASHGDVDGKNDADGSDDVVRLADAVAAFLEYETGGGERGQFLSRHEDLRDLLEPMLEGDDGEEQAATAERYVGEYRLVRELGRGGMGVVYEAIQVTLGRRVALKILPAHVTLQPQRIERFRREARAVAKLSHPCILPIYDVGEADGTHYFAMEFVEGRDLAKALDALPARPLLPGHGAGAIAQAAEVIARVAEALHYAHCHSVLHRDVKPHNILLGDDGSVRLVDFGLARDDDRGTLSQSGEFVGTPHYASPEQLAGSRQAIDARSDVFSLGVVLYEALAHERPFDGATTQQVVDQIRTREPRRLRALNPKVPHDLGVICHKALEKDPRNRYATAADLAADLRRFLALEPIVAQPPGPLSRLSKAVRRNRLRATVAALATLLVVGTPYVLWRSSVSLHRRDQQHLDHARRLLSEAVDVLTNARIEEQPGSESFYLERLQRLARLYDEAIAGGPGDDELAYERATLSIRLAQTYSAQGRTEAALEAYDQAVQAFAALEAGHDGATFHARPRARADADAHARADAGAPALAARAQGLAHAHASALHDRSLLYRRLAKGDLAQRDLDGAVAKWCDLEVRTRGTDQHARIVAALAQAHGNRARLLQLQPGSRNAARAEFDEALRLWEAVDLSAEDCVNRRHRAVVRFRRGEMLMSSSVREAREDIEAALADFDALREAAPTDQSLRSVQAEALRALAHTLTLEGQSGRALEVLRRCEQTYAELTRDFPKAISYQLNFVATRLQLSRILATQAAGSDEAWELVVAALRDADRICERAPEIYDHWRARASLTHQRALLLARRPGTGTDDAIEAFALAVQRFRELEELQQKGEAEQCQMGNALYSLGNLQLRRGDSAAASESFAAAVSAERIAHASNADSAHHGETLRRYEAALAKARQAGGEGR